MPGVRRSVYQLVAVSPMNKTICLYRRGKARWISPSDLLINKNTPRGEPANLYERKPYGGRRLLDDDELLGRVVLGKFEIADCGLSQQRWEAIQGLGIPLDESKLFHNGAVLTDASRPFKTLAEALKERRT